MNLSMKASSKIAAKTVTDGLVPKPGGIKNAAQRTTLPTAEFPLMYLEVHESEVPWLKLFVRRSVKEFSGCTKEEKAAIWTALDIIEKEMITYYRPEKINIASFGNMLPQVHWHIMARFIDDPFFPEPMWGKKQRKADLDLPPMAPFLARVTEKLNSEST